jgi:murein DD-endopeptidase MepM/ murein hydrolase activator NlpD
VSVLRLRAALFSVFAALAACGGGGGGGGGGGSGSRAAGDPSQFCTTKPFAAPQESRYRLPYAVGPTFTMFQGNCPANPAWGHYGKFAYDFDLPLDTPVYAMRAGEVIFSEDRYLNSDHTQGHENGVWVRHEDGTVADYLHFSPSTVVPAVGTAVEAGDLLGFSGDSGGSPVPHLHVEAFANGSNFDKANTIPLTFNNAEGVTRPSGELIQGNAYTALPLR